MPKNSCKIVFLSTSAIGEEYEAILIQILSSLNVPFIEENGMRKLGYPKTPDILLPVPIGRCI